MLFTLGRTSLYEEYIEENTNPLKLGESPDYKGGAVWLTREEVQAFVDSLPNKYCPDWYAQDFSVYGVEADWEKDVYDPNDGSPWRCLRDDVRLVKLS